jgi:GNAT superfamily N-acetyltransferase
MRIRDARHADVAAIARVHVDSWRTTYAGLVPEPYLAGLSYERSEQQWLRGLDNTTSPGIFMVAETDDGQVVGFANGGPEREGRNDYQGELYALYLLQAYQQQGLGRPLVAGTASRLLQRGLMNMLVWVLADNPSRGFYERLGGQFVAEKPIEIGGVTLSEVAYGWRNLQSIAGHISSIQSG